GLGHRGVQSQDDILLVAISRLGVLRRHIYGDASVAPWRTVFTAVRIPPDDCRSRGACLGGRRISGARQLPRSPGAGGMWRYGRDLPFPAFGARLVDSRLHQSPVTASRAHIIQLVSLALAADLILRRSRWPTAHCTFCCRFDGNG